MSRFYRARVWLFNPDRTSLLALVLIVVALIMLFIPVKTVSVEVIGKRWETWMKLQEDYVTSRLVCTGKGCVPQTSHHTRTHETAVLQGGPFDAVEYPPEFTTHDDWYNESGGTFTIAFRLNDGGEREYLVAQADFERNYFLGLRCVARLNIYGMIVDDTCSTIGR